MPSQRCSPNVPQNRDTAGASSRKLACRTTAGTAPQTGADTSSLADSAYASMAAPSNTSNTSIGMQRIDTPRNALGDVGSEGRLIAGTGYRTFLGLGTPAAKQHYRIVRGPISDSIKQYLDDTHTKPLKMWAVVPKLIGNSEAEATLHLVVLCEPDLESTIRSCFTQQHILAMLSYKNGGKLNFLIIPQCPKSRSATLDISVHCHDYFPSTRTTYCGVSLILEDMVARSPQNKAHRATFGGIVKALYGNGETAFFGVTAGHAVAEVSCLREERDTATNAITSELQSSPEGHRVSPTALGRVLDYKQLPGVSAERAKQTHDWAIFEVDTILRNEAIGLNQDRNRIQEDGNKPCHSISKAAHPTFHDGASDPVLLLNGAHESLRGELSELPARVWISHTAEFVDCYILDLDEGESKYPYVL